MLMTILTAALVLITAAYAYLTYRLAVSSEASVQAVRSQTEALSRPYITVAPFWGPHSVLLYLRVENTGRSAAEHVRLELDKDFYQFGRRQEDHNLRKMHAFSSQIDSIAPGERMLFALGQGWVIFGPEADADACPSHFTVTAKYGYAGGGRKEETNHVDLRPFVGAENERDPIVEGLAEVARAIGKAK